METRDELPQEVKFVLSNFLLWQILRNNKMTLLPLFLLRQKGIQFMYLLIEPRSYHVAWATLELTVSSEFWELNLSPLEVLPVLLVWPLLLPS